MENNSLRRTTISQLEPKSKFVNLVGVLVSLENPTTTETGKTFQEGILNDETGQVKVTFWEDQVRKFAVNDRLLFEQGWCKEFEGDLQISTGMHGKVIKLQPAPSKVAG
jgi:ssDNA-binding replication factor A large subunit